jgi:hypothetical protein
MEEVFSHGLMVGCMMGSTMMIKSKDKEFSYGQMEGNMMVNGLMVSNMVREYIILQKGKLRKENGKKEKELDG